MRIATGGISHETSTFTLVATDLDSRTQNPTRSPVPRILSLLLLSLGCAALPRGESRPIEHESPSTRTEFEKRMQEEFVDLYALDTGRYKGLVIQDPQDKQNTKGFVYLALAVGEELDPPTSRAIPQLAEAINKLTLINAKVEKPLALRSRALFKAPFVYITAAKSFSLTEQEKDNLEKYMRQGGFVFAENSMPRFEYGAAEASLRKMFKDVLRKDARFQFLPNDHPIYHSFFDFDNGPPPGGEIYGRRPERAVPSPHLEGIYLDGRLVAVYSDKGYGLFWQDEFDNEPQLKMGVNLVVYSLTQEGSIAQQQIDLFMQRDH